MEKQIITLPSGEVYWFQALDSTHCRFCCAVASDGYDLGLTEVKFQSSMAWHIAQLNSENVEALNAAGLTRDNCRFFKTT